MSEGRFVSGNRVRLRSDIETRALRAAKGMRSLGVDKGDRIALLLRNDLAFFEATFAANALGVSPVAVNWHLAAPEIAYVLSDCQAKIVVAHTDLLSDIGDAIPAGVTVLAVETPLELAAALELDRDACRLRADQTSWETWLAGFDPLQDVCTEFVDTMIYTSGTTGKPKGVRRFPQAPDVAAEHFKIRDKTYGIKPGIRALICGPLYHGAPNSFGMRCAKIADEIILMPRFDPVEFLQLVEQYRITTVFMVPTMFVRLLKLSPEERDRHDLSSLEYIVTAAAHCPAEVKEAMQQWLGPIVHEFYAATEVSYVTLCDPRDSQLKPGTVGKPVEGVRLRILDENGDEVPTGGQGEVYSKLSCGPEFTYHNRPVDRAALEVDGLIATGDVGFVDEDGYLFLCDRRRDMVISGGVNIYPAEIEAALVGMPQLQDSAVFGLPEAEYGEKLVAVIQPQPGQTISQEEVISYLRTRVAGFKVPRQIEFQSDLPRDDSGKIYKRKIRERFLNGD